MRVNPDDRPVGDVASQVRQDEAAERTAQRDHEVTRQQDQARTETEHRSWMRDVFVPKA